MQSYYVLGMRVDDVTFEECLERMEGWIRSREVHRIVTPNPEFVMAAREDPDFLHVLNESSLAIPDGIGLILAARLAGGRIREHVRGTDLVHRASALCARRGYRMFLLGERLLEAGETVVALDNLFSTDRTALQKLSRNPGFLFLQGDVADESAVRQAFRSGVDIDIVYHLAAQASAHPSAAPTRYTEETNLVGPRVVLEQAAAAGVRSFVFGSSLQVYGRRPLGRVDESSPLGPILDIAHLSKVYVEKLMEMFAHTRGLRCVAARLGLVYGLSPVMKTDPRFMTAPNKFCRQVTLGEPLRIDATGYHPTALIQVDEAARGLRALAQGPWEGFTAVNLVGETASIAQVARLVRDLAAGKGLAVQFAEPENPPVPAECSFSSRASEAGFAPSLTLAEGLAPVLEHFLAEVSPHPNPLPLGEGTGGPPPLPLGEGRGEGLSSRPRLEGEQTPSPEFRL